MKVAVILGALFLCPLSAFGISDSLRSTVSAPAGGGPNSMANGTRSPQEDLPIDGSARIPVVDFKDVSIGDALSALLRPLNVNIWVSPELTGTITVYLSNVAVIDAVEFILKENKLLYTVEDNIIRVYPPDQSERYPVELTCENDLLSLDFAAVPLQWGINRIIEATGKNIIITRGTTGNLTGKLKDIPIEKGLLALLTANGFGVDIQDGITYVKPPSDLGEGRSRSSHYQVVCSEGKVSLDVRNADLQGLLEDVCSKCGLQLVMYGVVSGTITAKGIDLGLEELFAFLLRGTEYTFRRDGSVFQFGSVKIEELRTNRFLKLNHLVADDIIGIIPVALSSKLSVQIVKGQNGLLATGPYNLVKELSDFVASLDVPPAQILIEALVVDFATNYLTEFSLLANNTGQQAVDATVEKYYPEIQLYSSGKKGEERLQEVASRLGIAKIGHLSADFYIRLRALSQEGKANIRSRPVIAALNGHEASINIGTTQYYLLKTETVYSGGSANHTSQVSQRFETIKADVSLSLVPWVTAADEIIVDIRPEFNTPQEQFDPNIPPTINHRLLKSTVRLRNGETIVLGGLIQSTESVQMNELPLLGDIPILGRLFQNRSRSSTDSELLIFLTPTIYYGSEGSVDISKYKKK